VVAPISNDKILPSDSNSSSVAGKKRADQGTSNQKIVSNESSPQDENSAEKSSVDVERANQIYSQSTAKPSSKKTTIANPERALTLAADIHQQIEENSAQALKAQTGGISNSLSALLEAAPI
jgi:hypothetical protein